MIKLSKEKSRVTNIRRVEYKDHPIILRQIGFDMFEYLFVWKEEIYTTYVLYSPPLWRWILPARFRHSQKSLKTINEMLMSSASATLDTLLDTTTLKDNDIKKDKRKSKEMGVRSSREDKRNTQEIR